MRQCDPPRAATWMLEHLTPADRDDALAGDLLEDFRAGRSNGWYWRQTIAACTVGWIGHLGQRRMLVTFAALWSMLAPEWLALELRIVGGSRASLGTWRMDAPGVGSIGWWLLLNLGFIWAGMLLYFVSHANCARTFTKEQVVHATAFAVPIFFFAYIGSFILANLYSYPGPLVARSTITPFRELTDLRGWADLLRIPYFISLLAALWGTTANRRGSPQAIEATEVIGTGFVPRTHDLALLAEPEQWSATRFFGFMLTAGLLNAVIAAWILCRLPDDYFPSLASLLARAVFCVAVTALAGVGAARFYWNRAPHPPASTRHVKFATFALASAAGWVWIPSAMFLSTQNSPASALIAAIGAALLGIGLRKAIPAAPQPQEESGMFVAILRKPRFEAAGYVIAASLYLAFLAFAARQNVNAGAPLAVGAFLFAWAMTRESRPVESADVQTRSAARRLIRAAVLAVLLTLYALLSGVQLRNEKAARAAAAAAANGARATAGHGNNDAQGGGNGLMAWKSVVLWPAPPKKQGIVAPRASLLAIGSTEPLIIHFVGPYWYFHAPDTEPGPHAHQGQGNPLTQPIVANDFVPLVMEARQNLAAEIPLSRCREIEIALDYRKQESGISVALLLANSADPGKKQLYLGQQQVVGEWEMPADRNASGIQSERKILHFDVPAHAQIRGFDQVLVMFLTDPQHALVGPKIAIEDFRLLPR